MTLDEKVCTLTNELVGTNNLENTLIIIDPYIFPKKHDDDYKQLFCKVIERVAVNNVIVFTDKSKMSQNIKTDIVNELNSMSVHLRIHYLENMHDRFWIIAEKNIGISIGTSLNGFGKNRMTRISKLNFEEITEIKEYINI